MSSPADLRSVTVTGTFYKANGEPAGGSISFTPSTTIGNALGEYLIAATPIIAYLDALGRVSVSLYATDNQYLRPAGWTWVMTTNIGDTASKTLNLTLPASLGTANIARIVGA